MQPSRAAGAFRHQKQLLRDPDGICTRFPWSFRIVFSNLQRVGKGVFQCSRTDGSPKNRSLTPTEHFLYFLSTSCAARFKVSKRYSACTHLYNGLKQLSKTDTQTDGRTSTPENPLGGTVRSKKFILSRPKVSKCYKNIANRSLASSTFQKHQFLKSVRTS